MTHRAVIEAGPATIRRLCCGATEATESVLEWIDDPVALVDGRPVATGELLRSALACPADVASVRIIHPSWWPARRLRLVSAAARELADDVVVRPRSQLLRNAVKAAVVVEIAPQLVAVTADDTVAEPRIGPPEQVAEAVARRVAAAVRDRDAPVVIDAPAGVGGAQALAGMIAQRLPGEVSVVDELPVKRPSPNPVKAPEPAPVRTRGRLRVPLATAAALSVVAVGLRAHPGTTDPSTNLLEGRVAVQVPADWPVRRVTAGPGSARVEVASPGDPHLILHITQAPAAGDTLDAVVEPLQRALELADAEAPGVFVGFDPDGLSAGRKAVTYRENRDGHHVDWAVLVDQAVRIGIGCQSGPDDDALRLVCEQAVRSAHAVG